MSGDTLSPSLVIGTTDKNGNVRLTSAGYRYLAALSKALPTPWVAYTPTFTGFGTVSAVSIWSRRIGDTLYGRGFFAAGTPTAVEARISFGFNGVNGGISSDATKVAAIQQAGVLSRGLAGAQSFSVLIESNVGYLTFGVQSAGSTGLTKVNGNALVGVGTLVSLQFEVPISGW